MTSETLEALVRRYFEEAPDKPDLYDEILTEDFRVHPVHHATVISDEGSGPPAFKAFAGWVHSIWSSPSMKVEDVFSDGERVAARWTFYGRHDRGPFLGLPPTGKEISYSGITLFRVAHGKLAEGWALFDRLWLFQQLGVVPETGEFLARAAHSGTAEPGR
jgi:predicted ester cyclase